MQDIRKEWRIGSLNNKLTFLSMALVALSELSNRNTSLRSALWLHLCLRVVIYSEQSCVREAK